MEAKTSVLCDYTGKHSPVYQSAENGQCLFVCKDCGEVTTVYEDSNP